MLILTLVPFFHLLGNGTKGVLRGVFSESVENQFITDDYIITETNHMITISDVKTGNRVINFGGGSNDNLDSIFTIWPLSGFTTYDEKNKLFYAVLNEKNEKRTILELNLKDYPNLSSRFYEYKTFKGSKILSIRDGKVLYYEFDKLGDTKETTLENLNSSNLLKNGRLGRITNNNNCFFMSNHSVEFSDIYYWDNQNLRKILNNNQFEQVLTLNDKLVYTKGAKLFVFASTGTKQIELNIDLSDIVGIVDDSLYYLVDNKIMSYSLNDEMIRTFKNLDYTLYDEFRFKFYFFTENLDVYLFCGLPSRLFLFKLTENRIIDIPIYNYRLELYRPMGDIVSIIARDDLYILNTSNGRIDIKQNITETPKYNKSSIFLYHEEQIFIYDKAGNVDVYFVGDIEEFSIPVTGNNFSYIDETRLYISKDNRVHQIDTNALIKHEYFDNGIVYLFYDKQNMLIKTYDYSSSSVINEFPSDESYFSDRYIQQPYFKTRENSLISLVIDKLIVELKPNLNEGEIVIDLFDYNPDIAIPYYFNETFENQHILVRNDSIFEFNYDEIKRYKNPFGFIVMLRMRDMNVVDDMLYMSSVTNLSTLKLTDITSSVDDISIPDNEEITTVTVYNTRGTQLQTFPFIDMENTYKTIEADQNLILLFLNNEKIVKTLKIKKVIK